MAITGSLSWEKVHYECRQVSNASIVCSDGVIHTHKLVLANVSQLLGTIMRDIPVGDVVTIYLRDFPTRAVEQFLMECSQNLESNQEELVFLLGVNSKTYKTYLVKKENSLINQQERMLVKTEISYQDEEAFYEGSDNVAGDEFIANDLVKVEINIHDNDKDSEEKIKEIENEIIRNPMTLREEKFNLKIDKKIRYEKAKAAVTSGRAKSCREAAKMFGVSKSVLYDYVNKGTSFQGAGSTLKKFSLDEEKLIIERIKRLVEGGRNLTIKLIGEVITEEADEIKINQPERMEDMQSVLKKGFVHNFAKRNNLIQSRAEKLKMNRISDEEENDQEDVDVGNIGSQLDIDYKSEYATQNPEVLVDNFDKETREKIKEFENEVIENPVTPKDIKLNKKIDKKIRYEKAVAAVTSGQIKSCRVAAKLYGVSHQTVWEFITKGTSYQGPGSTLKKFSKEEEKLIIERIKKLIEDGRNLTIKLIGQVIAEEAEVIKINQPERSEDMQSVLKKGFVHNFAKRNDLSQLCDTEAKKDRDERRHYECEVCYKKFTKKSACVGHMKTLHGFLYSLS